MLRDKLIENTLHVRDILRNISKSQQLKATVVFSVTEIFEGVLYYHRREKQLFFKLSDMDSRFQPDKKINVSFLLKETVFSFKTTIINMTDDILELEPPVVFTSSFKRYYSRYSPAVNEELLVKMPDGS
ncbi:MAG: hypothetical protein J7L77_06860, partial [Clostridiales bacterium]|nr:hypothetical protein [Clostridiales bacterium]